MKVKSAAVVLLMLCCASLLVAATKYLEEEVTELHSFVTMASVFFTGAIIVMTKKKL